MYNVELRMLHTLTGSVTTKPRTTPRENFQPVSPCQLRDHGEHTRYIAERQVSFEIGMFFLEPGEEFLPVFSRL